MSRSYYNEFDPNAAQWLRNLIAAGHIAPGDVDERSIEDVTPTDLLGYTQCHFFAGIGIWSSALRAAGWPDSRPIWTGSCPCQPFSQAGKGDGLDDERHLWPAFLWLIQHGKGADVPVFGEQVASKDGLAWLDIVRADLEAQAYSFRPVDICAAGIGAPHIRQRIFFVSDRGVGYAGHTGLQGNEPASVLGTGRRIEGGAAAEPGVAPSGMADAGRIIDGGKVQGTGAGQQEADRPSDIAGGYSGSHDQLADPSSDGHGKSATGEHSGAKEITTGEGIQRKWLRDEHDGGSANDRLAHAGHDERGGRNAIRDADGEHDGTPSTGQGRGAERIGPLDDVAVRSTGDGMAQPDSERRATATIGGLHHPERHLEPRGDVDHQRPGPTNGFWRAADWIFCKDGKWRCVEPGTQPLVDGFAPSLGRGKSTVGGMARSNRTLRLKGYGNGINREVAIAFIKAVMEQ